MAYPQTDVQTLKMSFEDFLKYDEHMCAEWVNGEVFPMSPASDRHQNVNGFLESILRIYVESKNLGIIRGAPFLMRLNKSKAREPDLLFLSNVNQDRLLPTYLDGAADLVIEIISPESIARDREIKFSEYEQAGIPEYWLIDPILKSAEFYQLENDDYRTIDLQDGIYHSKVLTDFQFIESWLWQDPLPNILDILKHLNVI
ncbi:MAG: Uma2 family endonuclease [Candidatus Latescibacteria bacterium]|jgi:Uma2 family endonuclease|nr:Uma2 family endonuclease [Candidatus Latescibacterota bacterium]MBT4136820.1 Uma2 family endonuclease [Candidatus Latescibacterota bacterium]